MDAERPLLIETESADSKKTTSHIKCASKFDIAVNVVGVICYPLGVPYGMGQSGWVIGSFFLAYSSIATYATTVLLGRLCATYPELNSYPAIAEKAFGSTAGLVTSSIQWIGFFFLVVYNLVMLGEYCSILNIVPGMCQQEYIIYCALIIAALGQIPTWKGLAFLAIIFLGITAFGLVTLVYEADVGKDDDVTYSSITFSSAINGMTAIAFAYGGSGMFPEMIQEMSDPTEFNGLTGSLTMAYCIIIPSYYLAGYIGFWAWGNDCAGNIVENFPANQLRTTLVGVNLFIYIFGCLEANQLLAGKAERYIGVHPTAWLSDNGDGGLPPGLGRGIVRVTLLACQLFFAEMLFSAGVGDIQSLTGAIAGMLLTYIMPVLFYYKIISKEDSSLGCLYAVSTVLAVFITVAGVAVAIISIEEAASEYTLFGGSCVSSLDDD